MQFCYGVCSYLPSINAILTANTVAVIIKILVFEFYSPLREYLLRICYPVTVV